MADLLVASDLSRRYGEGPTSTHALRGASFSIRAGEYLAIIGRSGSGKSTLLNLLGLLDRPTDGSLELLGERVDRLDDGRRAAMRNRHIGFIFQFHHLLPEFSVRENVLMPARIAGRGADRPVEGWADELLALLGLEDLAAKPADELSGGQKQRVAIGRSLINRPALVLADEPTGNLDSENAADVNRLFRRVRGETGTTFVIVTHDPGVAESADRVIHVRDGMVARDTNAGDVTPV
ncbi:MAG: ABC transporter ATP-binding protein [Candidatus Limnocylindria bacterium]